jgi:hypothetical protein
MRDGDICYNSNVGNHYVFQEVTSNFKLCKFCFNCMANMFSCFAPADDYKKF